MKSRWLVILPALWFALVPQPAKADPQPGLNAVGYTIDQIPPVRSDSVYPTCGSEIENNINRNFNGEPFQSCGWDFFMVHYTGFITIPENTSVQFMVAADDGGTVNIDGHEFGTWNLKGCSWSQQVTLPLSGGTYPLDGWFFEAGGGTCYMLAWKLDDAYWEIVPEWAYTTESTPPTTTSTSTVPSTTVPATTTTSTTVQETTTTVEPTTTTEITETSTTSTTTTTTEPETTTTSSTTTTTEVPWVPPPTVHTTLPATTTTSTTEVPEPSTTTELSTTTTSVLPTATTQPPRPSTTIPGTTSTLPPTTTIAPTTTVLPSTTVATPVPETQEEVVALVTSAAALSALPVEDAKQVFAELDVTELDNAQEEALIAAVQEAPTEVREAFEEEVDVFKAGFDDYVPLGSNIPVGTRRTLIAVTAGITLAAAGTRMKR